MGEKKCPDFSEHSRPTLERTDNAKAWAEPRAAYSGRQDWNPGMGRLRMDVLAPSYFVLPWQVPEQLPPQMQDTVPSQVPEQSVQPLFAVGVPESPKTTAPYFAS